MAELPPGPRLPTYLQTALLVLRPEATLRRWHRRHGDVFTARSALSGRLVFLADPAAIRDVFTAPPDALRAGEANAFLAPVLGTRSVLVLDGEEHLRQRRLLLPPFHGERMRAYEAIMREAADADVDTWPVGRPFALLGHMQSVTLEVIARAVFGVEAGEPEGAELRARLRALLTPMGGRLRLLLLALGGGLLGGDGLDQRFAARLRAVDELLHALIAGRRADPELGAREDVCALLLQARDPDGAPMTDAEVRDELMTLLVAGHETTASELAWAFERLTREPAVLARLADEIDRDDGDAYLTATIHETLRRRPVLPNAAPRLVMQEIEVGGWTY
ncbi:MAG TPA: cytochrome P450, partial [Solirubrobacteraceae bacterium]|nr:cytochrome P450 [Solirubrobacteraceae bacterium]